MQTRKDRIIRLIRARAESEVEKLAGDFARSASADKEAILAALKIERWLAESCTDALDELC